jgi:hypothetical protein
MKKEIKAGNRNKCKNENLLALHDINRRERTLQAFNTMLPLPANSLQVSFTLLYRRTHNGGSENV